MTLKPQDLTEVEAQHIMSEYNVKLGEIDFDSDPTVTEKMCAAMAKLGFIEYAGDDEDGEPLYNALPD